MIGCAVAIGALLADTAVATPWTRTSAGLPDKWVDANDVEHNAVRALAQLDGAIYAGLARGGVYRSVDNAASWSATAAPNALLACEIAQMAALPPHVFAACRYPGGMFRFDASAPAPVWEQVNNGLGGLARNGQAVIAVGDVLYYAAAGPFNQPGPGAYASADHGGSWTRVTVAGMADQNVFALAYDGAALFAGTLGDNATLNVGVAYRIRPGLDDAWTLVDDGFEPNGSHWDSVFALAAAPGVVVAGSDDKGVYRSLDQGGHWQKVTADLADVWGAIVVNAHVLFGTSHGGVYRSDDGGATFAPDDEGLAYGNQTLPELAKQFLAKDGLVYVATDLGVFRQPLLPDALFADDFE